MRGWEDGREIWGLAGEAGSSLARLAKRLGDAESVRAVKAEEEEAGQSEMLNFVCAAVAVASCCSRI
jgi:hypothetical protein